MSELLSDPLPTHLPEFGVAYPNMRRADDGDLLAQVLNTLSPEEEETRDASLAPSHVNIEDQLLNTPSPEEEVETRDASLAPSHANIGDQPHDASLAPSHANNEDQPCDASLAPSHVNVDDPHTTRLPGCRCLPSHHPTDDMRLKWLNTALNVKANIPTATKVASPAPIIEKTPATATPSAATTPPTPTPHITKSRVSYQCNFSCL